MHDVLAEAAFRYTTEEKTGNTQDVKNGTLPFVVITLTISVILWKAFFQLWGRTALAAVTATSLLMPLGGHG